MGAKTSDSDPYAKLHIKVGIGHSDTELGQFGLNAWATPGWIGLPHTPDESVGSPEAGTRVLWFQDMELIPQGQVLEHETATAATGGHQCPEQDEEDVKHRPRSLNTSYGESLLQYTDGVFATNAGCSRSVRASSWCLEDNYVALPHAFPIAGEDDKPRIGTDGGAWTVRTRPDH